MSFEAHYEREGSPGWPIKSWDTANKLLGYQNAEGPSFSIFTVGNGSFVQCAGGKTRLTIEARIIGENDTFQHYRFGKGPLTGQQAEIECNCGPILVDRSQVLKMRDARLIIRHFVETSGGLLPGYEAQEVSNAL